MEINRILSRINQFWRRTYDPGFSSRVLANDGTFQCGPATTASASKSLHSCRRRLEQPRSDAQKAQQVSRFPKSPRRANSARATAWHHQVLPAHRSTLPCSRPSSETRHDLMVGNQHVYL